MKFNILDRVFGPAYECAQYFDPERGFGFEDDLVKAINEIVGDNLEAVFIFGSMLDFTKKEKVRKSPSDLDVCVQVKDPWRWGLKSRLEESYPHVYLEGIGNIPTHYIITSCDPFDVYDKEPEVGLTCCFNKRCIYHPLLKTSQLSD